MVSPGRTVGLCPLLCVVGGGEHHSALAQGIGLCGSDRVHQRILKRVCLPPNQGRGGLNVARSPSRCPSWVPGLDLVRDLHDGTILRGGLEAHGVAVWVNAPAGLLDRGELSGEGVGLAACGAAGEATAEQINDDISAAIRIDPEAPPAGLFSMGFRMAEGLPDYLWACPECFTLDGLTARGNHVTCQSCQTRWTLDTLNRMNGEKPLWVHEAFDRISERFEGSDLTGEATLYRLKGKKSGAGR